MKYKLLKDWDCTKLGKKFTKGTTITTSKKSYIDSMIEQGCISAPKEKKEKEKKDKKINK